MLDNEYTWRPMPDAIAWHEDITPIVDYLVETHKGEFIRGAFYNHRGAFFAESLTVGAVRRLYEIKRIRRLKSKGDLFPCPVCGVISLNPTRDGLFKYRGCDNDHCDCQWWNKINKGEKHERNFAL